MTRINSTRIGGIIKYIAQVPATKSQVTHHTPTSGEAQKKQRSLEVLRTRLRHRLESINPDGENFLVTASTIVIQEILSWEFGAQILDHPEFHQITQDICKTMMDHPDIALAMENIIKQRS